MKERITNVNGREFGGGRFVLIWAHKALRIEDNAVLSFACSLANELKVPLLYPMPIYTIMPFSQFRHHEFIMQGISEMIPGLQKLNVEIVICFGDLIDTFLSLASEAAAVVTMETYLKFHHKWRTDIPALIKCPFISVESRLLFPPSVLTDKAAYNAASLRRKIHARVTPEDFEPVPVVPVQHEADANLNKLINSLLPENSRITMQEAMAHYEQVFLDAQQMDNINTHVGPSDFFKGGSKEARAYLKFFLENSLEEFHAKRNDPGIDHQTKLSPYINYGMISVQEVVREVVRALRISMWDFLGLVKDFKPGTHPDARVNGALTLFEEMIVRRELAFNYVYYTPDYDQYSALPAWARTTLREHVTDTRKQLYTPDALEQADTSDPYWNAAQKELVITGKMHGYMRMYWGKKILQWCAEPEDAFQIAIHLNDKYSLDDRDPNGYAGVGWCFGLHDRAWPPFPIFGTVRTMSETGLSRKFDMNSYLKRIANL